MLQQDCNFRTSNQNDDSVKDFKESNLSNRYFADDNQQDSSSRKDKQTEQETKKEENQPSAQHPEEKYESHDIDQGDFNYQFGGQQQEQPKPSSLFKRIAIATILTLPLVGALYYSNRNQEKAAEANTKAPIVKNDNSKGNSNTALNQTSNLIFGVDEAIKLVKEKKIEPSVKEVENKLTPNFTYEFTLKESPSPSSSKLKFLKGVIAGPERDRLLKAFQENGVNVVSESTQPQISLTGGSSINPNKPSKGPNASDAVFNIVVFGAVIVGAVILVRALRNHARKSMEDGLNSLVTGKGEVVEKSTDRFSDIGGLSHVIEEMTELKSDMMAVINGNQNIKLPKGILLAGGPGTGKTLLARATAGETNVPFITLNGSQFTQMLKGTGPASVKNGLEMARKLRDNMTYQINKNPKQFPEIYNPQISSSIQRQGICIVFLDEFDSIGEKRDSGGIFDDDERKNVVNALLQEMDGVNKEKNRNIIIMAATNFAHRIDDALRRPGRFTKTIQIPLPRSPEDRLDILQKLSKNLVVKEDYKYADDKALEYVSRATIGKSGDELRAILVEATDIVRRDKARAEKGIKVITNDDLLEAYQRLDFGREIKMHMAKDKHQLVAHHEHGHGIMALTSIPQNNHVNLVLDPTKVDDKNKILIVSMKPRSGRHGESLGRVVLDPESMGEILLDQGQLLANILITAGGRAAELAAYGKLGMTMGASMDLEQIRGLVKEMISNGMLEDLYAVRLDHVQPHQMKEVHTNLIDQITKHAINVSKEMIETIGHQKMVQLVQDSLSLEKELIGTEAQKFYDERLEPELKQKLIQIAQKFFDNPTGKAINNVTDSNALNQTTHQASA